MKIIDFRCRYCGNRLSAPEGTKRVLCGQCTHWNVPGKKSLREKFGEFEEFYENLEKDENRGGKSAASSIKREKSPESQEEEKKKGNPLGLVYMLIIIVSSFAVIIKEKFEKGFDKKIEEIFRDPDMIAIIIPVASFVIFLILFVLIKKGLADFKKRNRKS